MLLGLHHLPRLLQLHLQGFLLAYNRLQLLLQASELVSSLGEVSLLGGGERCHFLVSFVQLLHCFLLLLLQLLNHCLALLHLLLQLLLAQPDGGQLLLQLLLLQLHSSHLLLLQLHSSLLLLLAASLHLQLLLELGVGGDVLAVGLQQRGVLGGLGLGPGGPLGDRLLELQHLLGLPCFILIPFLLHHRLVRLLQLLRLLHHLGLNGLHLGEQLGDPGVGLLHLQLHGLVLLPNLLLRPLLLTKSHLQTPNFTCESLQALAQTLHLRLLLL